MNIVSGGANEILGVNTSPLYAITSALFVVILFFYILSVGSYLQVDVSSFENRINYHNPFLTYVVNKNVDQIVIVVGTALWLLLSLLNRLKIMSGIYIGVAILAIVNHTAFDVSVLSSFPLVMSLLIYHRVSSFKILKIKEDLYLNYLAIFFTVLTSVSFIISLLPLLSVQSNKIITKDYAYFVFLIFSSISPILIFFVIISSSVKLLIGRFISKLKISQISPSIYTDQKSSNTITYLILLMFFAVTLSLIPHSPVININNQEVSADSGDYVSMIRSLQNAKNLQEFVQQAFVSTHVGDRPITLLFLYFIAEVVPANLSYTIDHLPILLTPLLVLSIFVLTREITSNDKISLLAAFLTAVSFQTLIGIYGGLFANLFSLVIGYFSFAFLIKFLKKPTKANFSIFAFLMVVFVYSHVYTWTILTLVMTIFLLLMYKMNYYNRKRIILLFLIISFTVVIDVSRTLITNVNGGIMGDTSLASTGAGIGQLFLSWNTLTDTMQNYAGGLLGDFIIYALVIYWLIKTDLRNPLGTFLGVFISIGTLPLLFGNGVIQSRVFYDIPFQIPAAIALSYVSKRKNGLLLVLPICIWLVAISLKMVTNFYYVSP